MGSEVSCKIRHVYIGRLRSGTVYVGSEVGDKTLAPVGVIILRDLLITGAYSRTTSPIKQYCITHIDNTNLCVPKSGPILRNSSRNVL